MIINYTKTGIQLLLFLWVIEILGKIFLKRTLFGRLFLSVIKDIWLSLKLSFRISKYSGKTAYNQTKTTYKFLNKKCKIFDNKKSNKNIKEKTKVVCGENDNIIDFQQAKNKHK